MKPKIGEIYQSRKNYWKGRFIFKIIDISEIGGNYYVKPLPYNEEDKECFSVVCRINQWDKLYWKPTKEQIMLELL